MASSGLGVDGNGTSLSTEQLTALDMDISEESTATVPAHRSHDPTSNLKRSDPFQFGSRFLEEGDNVFEFNAWDHVETDDAYKAYSEQQLAKQRQSPVSDFDKSKFSSLFSLLFQLVDDDTQPMHSSSEFSDDKNYLQFFRSHLTHHSLAFNKQEQIRLFLSRNNG